MHKTLTIKVVILGSIILLMAALLYLLEGQFVKQQRLYQQAKVEIKDTWTKKQQVMGPVLVVPYDIEVKTQLWNEDKTDKITKVTRTSHFKIILAQFVRAKVKLDHEFRHRQGFQVPAYDSVLTINGQFDVQAMQRQLDELEAKAQSKAGELILAPPILVQTISDMRGMHSISPLNWHGLSATFEPGSRLPGSISGSHAKLLSLKELLEHSKSHIAFNYELRVQGLEQITFVPAAMEFELLLDADWPHPDFYGHYAPQQLTINDSGYQANWRLSAFSSDIVTMIESCEMGDCSKLWLNQLGVKHVAEMDVYQQLQSSQNYALGMIVLTFIALLIIEVSMVKTIVSIVYGMSGLALLLFYPLLLALTEPLGFSLAYLLSMSCSLALIGLVLSAILDRNLSSGFVVGLLFMYLLLYLLLSYPQWRLVIEAVSWCAVMLVLVIATRRLSSASRLQPKLQDDSQRVT